jgi:methyl-accepting chemotaxis protein
VPTHLTRTAVVATAAALTLGLSACTGSDAPSGAEGSPEPSGPTGPVTLCEATAQLDELSSQFQEFDPTQLDEARASLEEITSTLENVDPPAEVADSVETVRTQLTELSDAVNRAVDNPLDADAVSKATESIQSMSEQTFTDATTEIQQYTEANC